MRGKTKQNLTQKQKKKAYAKLTKLKKNSKFHTKNFLIQKNKIYTYSFLQNYLFSAGKSLVFYFC